MSFCPETESTPFRQLHRGNGEHSTETLVQMHRLRWRDDRGGRQESFCEAPDGVSPGVVSDRPHKHPRFRIKCELVKKKGGVSFDGRCYVG
jgi:hypothetical protein